MAKICIVLSIISLVVCVHAESWATRLEAEKGSTVTNLQFYLHDTVSGKRPSAVKVAQSSDARQSPTLFGTLMMVDDPLTEGSDPSSKLVGRAQGLYGSAGQSQWALIMAMNFGFTDGEYNGSSISLVGINPSANPVREMPIVSGTALFRLVRGYAIARTHWLDAGTGDAIVHYNVTLVH